MAKVVEIKDKSGNVLLRVIVPIGDVEVELVPFKAGAKEPERPGKLEPEK